MNHGITGYTTYRCRCAICSEAQRKYERQWMRESRAGIRRTRDAREAAAHIGRLLSAGHTRASIASLAGVSGQTVANIADGRTPRVRHETAERILGVQLTDVSRDNHLVPRATARRLLRGMREAGFKSGEIVGWLGYAPTCKAVPIGKSHERITHRSHKRVVTLYRLLARQGLVPADLLEDIA